MSLDPQEGAWYLTPFVNSIRAAEPFAVTLDCLSGLSESVLASYTARMLDGLIYLHVHGIIHGHLRAANVIITKEGPKLCNFGLRLDVLTLKDGADADLYMTTKAPEIVERNFQSTKSDIWSLGCIIVELLNISPLAGRTSFVIISLLF